MAIARRTVRLRPVAWLLLATAVIATQAACLADAPHPSVARSAVPPAAPTTRPTPRPTSRPTAKPSALTGLPIDDLPRVKRDPTTLTAVCDAEPTQAFSGGPEPELHCSDAVELAVRAFAAETPDPIERIYVRRPRCFEGQPCPPELLDTATVTGWTARAAYSFELVWGTERVAAPAVGVSAAWPERDALAAPVERPRINGAPNVVANRTPHPFCGRYEVVPTPEVADCFVSAVLDGRPAEAIELGYAIEGEPYTTIYRFDGAGAIWSYVRVLGTWQVSRGGLSLNPGSGWSYDGWSETSRRIR